MTPFEQAKKVYESESCRSTFDDDRRAHDMYGFCFSTPLYFIMGRPVISTATPDLIVNPMYNFVLEKCDTWHVFLAAGDLSHAWEVLPWVYPYISFERKNELRFYQLAAMQRLSSKDPVAPPIAPS